MNKPTTGLKDYPLLRRNLKGDTPIHATEQALENSNYFPCNYKGEFTPHLQAQFDTKPALGVEVEEEQEKLPPMIDIEEPTNKYVTNAPAEEPVEEPEVIDERAEAEQKIRMKAKSLGIKYWHNRNIDKLMVLVKEAMDNQTED